MVINLKEIMAYEFTSLRFPLEKLLEAEYFLSRQKFSDGIKFQFELNAYLSAARSVTFYLQKNMSQVNKFEAWYIEKQSDMKSDPSMRFFLELRNISQKQGPISYIGGSVNDRWTYRFVSQVALVPSCLIGRDISECCAEHLTKLAQLIFDCYKEFPYESCPKKALTEEGMSALGYNLESIEIALGFPQGYITSVSEVPDKDKLRLMAKEVEPLEVQELERLASSNFLYNGEPLKFHMTNGNDLVDSLAKSIGEGHNPNKITFLKAIMERINDFEKE